MSDRNLDASLKSQLRDMQARLDRLETQNNKIRRNDIRLSDTIVTADSKNDRLCLENLVTGTVVCIGEQIPSDPTQAQWSFAGDLLGRNNESSPVYLTERVCTARQLIIARPSNKTMSGTVTVCAHFKAGALLSQISITNSEFVVVKEINWPMVENDEIFMELVNEGTNAEDISVFVRFGLPTVALSVSDCSV